MNILFSSTRQWNPGDEFIYWGIRNLLADFGVKYNPVLFNRNPLVQHKIFQAEKGHYRLPRLHENSYLHYPGTGLIDYIIYAGTPEWAGSRLTVVRDLIYNEGVRFSIIGVGCRKRFTRRFRSALAAQADVLIARDESAYQSLRPYGGIKLVDPSLFASSEEHLKTTLGKIGLCFQPLGGCKQNDEILTTYKRLIKKFDAQIICHTFVDLIFARQVFPKDMIVYSSYAEDYLHIYKDCDVIVGTRVHGSGLASSLGIPSILIPHDKRADTGVLLLAHMEEPRDIQSVLKSMNVEQESQRLIKYKAEQKQQYLKIMSRMSIV